MRVNKVLNLQFDNTKQTTAYLNVNFMVKNISITGIGYNTDLHHLNPKEAKYGYITSNLLPFNQPLGIYHQNSYTPFNATTHAKYEFTDPTPIQGYFEFNISVAPESGGVDDLILTIEFSD